MADPSEPSRRPYDTPVGLNIPYDTKKRLKRLAFEIEELDRKATMQDVLVYLIEAASAEEICEAFPARKQPKR
jgi:hypothetical protein